MFSVARLYRLNTSASPCRSINVTKRSATKVARMGGIARAKAYTKAELRAWGKQGGRPGKLDSKALDRPRKLLACGESQGERAKALGVSVRTAGRAVAGTRAATLINAP